MKKLNLIGLILTLISLNVLPSLAQVNEPEFIGEAFVLNEDSSTTSLDKEIADFTSGTSWSSNSWNALSLEIREGEALTRFSTGESIKIVIRATDNNSDPLTIVSIYKLKSKKNKRTVVLSEDNSGTLMKSRTNSKNMVRFKGKKFGASSYLIELIKLKPGEYGITISNPNNRDEKRTIVSCFGVD